MAEGPLLIPIGVDARGVDGQHDSIRVYSQDKSTRPNLSFGSPEFTGENVLVEKTAKNNVSINFISMQLDVCEQSFFPGWNDRAQNIPFRTWRGVGRLASSERPRPNFDMTSERGGFSIVVDCELEPLILPTGRWIIRKIAATRDIGALGDPCIAAQNEDGPKQRDELKDGCEGGYCGNPITEAKVARRFIWLLSSGIGVLTAGSGIWLWCATYSLPWTWGWLPVTVPTNPRTLRARAPTQEPHGATSASRNRRSEDVRILAVIVADSGWLH
jgi:hypothetical protein